MRYVRSFGRLINDECMGNYAKLMKETFDSRNPLNVYFIYGNTRPKLQQVQCEVRSRCQVNDEKVRGFNCNTLSVQK